MAIAAAMCMALGIESFDDWLMLTWSFGCTGDFEPSLPPSFKFAAFAITSFTFMLVCVPEPVCHTVSGKCSSSLPSAISCATVAMAAARLASRDPSARLTSAAARLITPRARTISIGIRSVPIWKLCSERSVCAPHSRSAGLSKGPKGSLSMRVLADFFRALSMEFVQRRHDPMNQTNGQRTELFLAEAIKSNHFATAGGWLFLFFAFGRWCGRLWRGGGFRKGRGARRVRRKSFFLAACRQRLLRVCGGRSFFALPHPFELKAKLHRRVKKAVDGFEGHRELFRHPAK